MPRVTITVPNIPDQPLISHELSKDLSIGDLKALIQAENPHWSVSAQRLFLNGMPLDDDSQTLEQAGIRGDDEMLSLLIRQNHQRAPPHTQPQQRPDPEGVRQHVLGDQRLQDDLKQRRPQLFASLHDPAAWRTAFNNMAREEDDAKRRQAEEMRRLNEDIMNPESQQRIAEIIRQENVLGNLHQAWEENPEVFVRVHMLYIPIVVNGVPVKAFVDSGAQATIMSPDCAERCGILRLLDTRYSGMARGVGTAPILGRVHRAMVNIGGAEVSCAFTVMDGKGVDLLFGLDMLKKYRAKIDLEKNALCLEGIEVPFLPENEIPKSFEDDEPSIPGPGNTEIGTKTGAIKPTSSAPEGSGKQPVVESSPQPAQAQVQASHPPMQPQPQAQPPPPGQASSSRQFPEQTINHLVSMGYPRNNVIQALEAASGDVNVALDLLGAQYS